MANQSIQSAFERLWYHIILKLNNYATTESLDKLLPQVTEDDNDKVLMVVDGIWAAAEATSQQSVLSGGGNDEKLIIDLPYDYDSLLSAGEFEIDAKMGAKFVQAAENLQPIFIRTSNNDGSTGIRKFEVSTMAGGIFYILDSFNISRGTAFVDTFTYNVAEGKVQAESHTIQFG